MNRKPIQAVVTIVFLFSAAVVFATDWTQWRGPDRNGITTDPAWTPEALASGANVAWEKNVGEGHSACAIRGSMLFTAGNKGEKDEIQCLNALDGSKIWTYAYSCAPGSYPGPRATPVLDGKNLYAFSRDAKVFCLNAADGKLIWKRDLTAEEDATDPKWGHASSPVIEGGLVILNACAHGIALDKNTGKTVWSSGKGEASYASAVPYSVNGKKCVAIFSAKEMNGVELKTGRKLWSHAWETDYNINAADPIISDGYLYLSSGYKTGAGLLDIKGSTPKQVWGVQGEMKNQFNSSVLIDGKLYGIAGNTGRGQLTCMDFKTGTVLWTTGKGYEGLISADGKLIIMDKTGVLTIAEVNPAQYVEVAKAQVLDGSAQNWTVPVLANGFIYCRNSKGRLVCVDVRK